MTYRSIGEDWVINRGTAESGALAERQLGRGVDRGQERLDLVESGLAAFGTAAFRKRPPSSKAANCLSDASIHAASGESTLELMVILPILSDDGAVREY
jgi:hypothetical protein